MTASQSGPPLGRPVGASGEQTRRRIIVATMRCVAEIGYAQATIREIARAADMTSGSLYHYFPNKSELLKATGEEIEDIVLPRLRAAAARSDDVIDRLEAVLDESKQLMRDYPHLAAFLRAVRAEGAVESRRGGTSYPGSKALREVVSEIIEDARTQGVLSSDNSPESGSVAAVEAICALTRGLSEQAASLSPEAYEASLSSVKKLVRGTLFAGLQPSA
ncbi:TetR/AcrR family transcriptional regulator [Mycobacterium riyadhense]|uniref:TetR family transcriptional regulator n=1 Tax=Mycobacterium riyadhense TaxID=486698 RepID=A0A1X2CW64_9MYCO|nr:TetR/AcrR family transcriptional regulator [Mycobacterium riyadhense]MCV7145299.1 TetR/AcrR family transcriptional regulator [Mycobacterium riyadhense]ORW80126.1 TetR family transcriptional regulator [Mycobacterium riyadhense]